MENAGSCQECNAPVKKSKKKKVRAITWCQDRKKVITECLL